jgi:hypothetical protein
MFNIVLILVLIGGVITLLGAIIGWEGMFRDRRSKRIVDSFGITGARIIYGIVGTMIAIASLLGLLGFFGN